MSRVALALVCLACTVSAEPDADSQKLRSLAEMLQVLQALNPPAAFSAGSTFPAHARNPMLNRHRASAAAARGALARNPKMVTAISPVRVKEVGTKDALAAVRKHFPSAEYMDDYIERLQAALSVPEIGINKENSIPITTLGRDESVRPLQDKIDSVFGQSFNTHGLAGLAHLGHTGMKAAMSHSPDPDGKERYVFFAISQVTIDHEGNVGDIDQAGIEEELLSIIKAVVDPAKADYVVVTGVQIHDSSAVPDGSPSLEFLAPSRAFAMVGGEEQPLNMMVLSQLSSLLDAQAEGFAEQVDAQASQIEELKKMIKLQSATIDNMKDNMKRAKEGGVSKTAVTAALACVAGVACGVR